MSIEMMTAVWKQSRHKGGKLILLLAIADYANDQGVAWPSIESLAEKTRMSERNVHYTLKELIDEADPELSVDANAGPYRTNLYRLNLQGAKSSGCKTTQKRVQNPAKRVQPTAPNPSLEPSIEPSERVAANAAPTPTLPRKEQDETVLGEWDAIQSVPEDIRRRPERVAPGSARDLDLALEFVCFDTQDSRETLALHRSWIAKERNALREINKHLDQPITGQEVRDKFKRGGIWYATWMAEDGRQPNPAEVTKYVRRLENEVKSAARLQREAQSTARTVVYPTIEPPAPISEDERRENLYILSRRPFAPKAASA